MMTNSCLTSGNEEQTFCPKLLHKLFIIVICSELTLVSYNITPELLIDTHWALYKRSRLSNNHYIT